MHRDHNLPCEPENDGRQEDSQARWPARLLDTDRGNSHILPQSNIESQSCSRPSFSAHRFVLSTHLRGISEYRSGTRVELSTRFCRENVRERARSHKASPDTHANAVSTSWKMLARPRTTHTAACSAYQLQV